MKLSDKPLNITAQPKVPLSQSNGSGTNTPALTLRQKFMMVLVTVFSSFAVGSIPVVYALTLAPTQNETTTDTVIIHGEMF